VRGLQTHGTETLSVKMGDRAAINLAGTNLDDLYRGAVIADPRWMKSTEKLIARVTLIEDTRWKLKNRQRVHLHIGTTEVVARAVMQKSLEAGQSGNVLFLMEKPIAALMNERFILRSLSPMETMGGCAVLDSNPVPIRKELKLWTETLKENPSERFIQFVSQNWKSPKSLGNWARQFQTTENQLKIWIKSEEILNEKGFLFTSEKRKKAKKIFERFCPSFMRIILIKNP
jgi:selenocysteine-specific elongation factor